MWCAFGVAEGRRGGGWDGGGRGRLRNGGKVSSRLGCYWGGLERTGYGTVERLLRRSDDFCSVS